LLEVRKTGNADPLVDINSAASDSQSLRLRNSAGATKLFVAGAADAFLTGTAAGDVGLLAGTSAKLLHIGGTASVLSFGNDNALLFRNGATTYGSMDPTSGRLAWERPIGENPRTTFFEKDDFVSGGQASAQIGKMGWGITNATYASQAAVSAGRPGIGRVTSSTTANQVCAMYLRAVFNFGAFYAGDAWTCEFWVRPVLADTTVGMRVGMSADPTIITPAAGAFFEKLAADTDWFPVSRAASSETRGTTLGAVSTTNWARLRVRKSGANVAFSVDGGAEQTISTNVSGSATLTPFIQIISTNTTSKNIDVDYWEAYITGMSR
jgi:hypothetical protein